MTKYETTRWGICDDTGAQTMPMGAYGDLEVHEEESNIFTARHRAVGCEVGLGRTSTRVKAMDAAVGYACLMGWIRPTLDSASECDVLPPVVDGGEPPTYNDSDESDRRALDLVTLSDESDRKTLDLVILVKRVWESNHIAEGEPVHFSTIREILKQSGMVVTNVQIRSALAAVGIPVKHETINEADLREYFTGEDIKDYRNVLAQLATRQYTNEDFRQD